MGDFPQPQPQQKYAGTGENCNIVTAAIFYPVIFFLLKILMHIICICKHSDFKFQSKQKFCKYF